MKEGIPTTQRGESYATRLQGNTHADSLFFEAWQQIARGKPKDVLRLVTDAPVPQLAADEVLVKGTFVSYLSTLSISLTSGPLLQSIPPP